MTQEKCFACDRRLSTSRRLVRTQDGGQDVYVGPDCYARIKAAGENGYQPPLGGPRLFLIPTTNTGD